MPTPKALCPRCLDRPAVNGEICYDCEDELDRKWDADQELYDEEDFDDFDEDYDF